MRALVGSVALHALLVWLVLHGGRDGDPRPPVTRSVAIRVVDAVEVDLLPNTDGDAREPGGAPAGEAPASGADGAGPRETRRAPRARAVDTDPRGAITIERADPRGALRADAHDTSGGIGVDGAPASTGNARSEDRERADGGGAFGFDGRGMGLGRGGHGRGTGIGFGDGGTIPPLEHLTPPPAPRGDPPSKARAPRLIYPTRQRDVEDAELFVARVIVDDEGFVAGARLVRGFGGRRDEVAAQMIWRFRYAPALDAEGRPIRATLDQRFLVGP